MIAVENTTILGKTAVILATSLLMACGSAKKDGAADEASKAPPATEKTAATAQAPATGADGICKEYADKVCAAAGEQSMTCSSFRLSTEVMADAACKAGIENLATTTAKIQSEKAVCEDLVKKLCDAIGPETKTCAMVTERTKAFPAQRCKQMASAEEFPKVVASLEQMEAQNRPLDAAKRAKIEGKDAASFGSATAKVTVVEFSDFECPYCTRAASAVDEVKKKYGDKVRVVFRHFPLSFHKNAHLASQASLYANSKGKFWEFHDLLFKNQKAMTRADLEKYAKELKFNIGDFKKALDGGTYKAAVDADLELGKAVSVQGTPTMFINGERVQNPTDINVISQQIDKLLAAN